jgi:hypothetical protein
MCGGEEDLAHLLNRDTIHLLQVHTIHIDGSNERLLTLRIQQCRTNVSSKPYSKKA